MHVAAVVTLGDLTSPRASAYTHEECATTVEGTGPERAFTLPMLNGPASYRGPRVALSWSVVATLRRGADVLATTAVPITVGEPLAAEPLEPLDYRGQVRAAAYQPSFGAGHREGPDHPPAPPLAFAAALEIARLFRRDAVAFELSVSPTRVRRGQDVEVVVTLQIRAPTVVESIAAWMVEYEGQTARVVPYAYEQEDQPSQHELCGRTRLAVGSHRYATRITVPLDAAPSYTAGALSIARLVRVAMQLDRSAPIVRDWHLAVH